jgi:predicted nucleic acid-binding protein
MEAEAVKGILLRISRGRWRGVSSSVVDLEVKRMPDLERLAEIVVMTSGMQERVEPEERDRKRAEGLMRLGFRALDALHLACAEKAGVDVFLSTDERLLRTAARSEARGRLNIRVENPLPWLEEVLKDEDADAGTP